MGSMFSLGVLAYYLRTERVEDAYELLDRWNCFGFVYPPHHGWVTILIDFHPHVYDQEHEQNLGLLLRLDVDSTSGFNFMMWRGHDPVAYYERRWIWRHVDARPANFLQVLVYLLPELAEHREELQGLLRLDGLSNELGGREALLRIVELFGLFFFDKLNFDLLNKNPNDAVDAGRWLGYEPRLKSLFDPTKPRPNRLTGVDLHAPKVLYGGRKIVMREWTKLTRKVWKGASWADVLANVEMVPLGEMGDEVVLGRHSSAPVDQDKKWRLCAVGEVIAELQRYYEWTNEARHKSSLACHEFPGSPFWFEAGMLEWSNYSRRFAPTKEEERLLAYRYFQRLTCHLHTFISIRDSIRPNWDYRNEPDRWWLIKHFWLANECGWPSPRYHEHLDRPRDEMLAYYLSLGAVREIDGRYEAGPMPAEPLERPEGFPDE